MQNSWNLYLACKQKQLYGPVNYRGFRETGPRQERREKQTYPRATTFRRNRTKFSNGWKIWPDTTFIRDRSIFFALFTRQFERLGDEIFAWLGWVLCERNTWSQEFSTGWKLIRYCVKVAWVSVLGERRTRFFERKLWAQLFAGRLALNPGFFFCVQKHFLG